MKTFSGTNDFSSLLQQLYFFLKEKLGFDEDIKLRFSHDSCNGSNILGKTGYYQPENSTITLFTFGRHPKDLLRSFAHEIIHHSQKCRGKFDEIVMENDPNYAQNNKHLREMEKEAYLLGNILFRDWEDGLKNSSKIKLNENSMPGEESLIRSTAHIAPETVHADYDYENKWRIGFFIHISDVKWAIKFLSFKTFPDRASAIEKANEFQKEMENSFVKISGIKNVKVGDGMKIQITLNGKKYASDKLFQDKDDVEHIIDRLKNVNKKNIVKTRGYLEVEKKLKEGSQMKKSEIRKLLENKLKEKFGYDDSDYVLGNIPTTKKHMRDTQKDLAKGRQKDIELAKDLEDEGFPSQIGAHELDEEEDENNPWAICSAEVGRDSSKYEDCVQSVKKQKRKLEGEHPMGKLEEANKLAKHRKWKRLKENIFKTRVKVGEKIEERIYKLLEQNGKLALAQKTGKVFTVVSVADEPKQLFENLKKKQKPLVEQKEREHDDDFDLFYKHPMFDDVKTKQSSAVWNTLVPQNKVYGEKK